ncbi:hypothetical protein BV898_18788 [Hypsibius exemplaris]|uniref:Uncharacterized protein n=1 Tax=Hypsibius exemplaris TaxID=2072580 RepID=A0A9X6NQN9_HYPEX|nr:hypothetical protein BV898_18788 [Hypsibius exemplaris]
MARSSSLLLQNLLLNETFRFCAVSFCGLLATLCFCGFIYKRNCLTESKIAIDISTLLQQQQATEAAKVISSRGPAASQNPPDELFLSLCPLQYERGMVCGRCGLRLPRA